MENLTGKVKRFEDQLTFSILNELHPEDKNSSIQSTQLNKERLFENTVSRLTDFNDKKNCKLEALRREQLISEIRSLQNKPNISENSKKIFKNYVPLYKRLNQVVKEKNEYKKGLQIESQLKKRSEFKENCTFNPRNISTSSRTPDEIVEFTYSWKTRKDQLQERLYQKKQEDIYLKNTEKPEISKKSHILTADRSLTPVVERLYELKDSQSSLNLSFIPDITSKSKKLFKGKRSTPIFERLYSLRKLPTCTVSPNLQKMKRSQKIIGFNDIEHYRININDGVIDQVPKRMMQSKSSGNFHPILQDIE